MRADVAGGLLTLLMTLPAYDECRRLMAYCQKLPAGHRMKFTLFTFNFAPRRDYFHCREYFQAPRLFQYVTCRFAIELTKMAHERGAIATL